MPWHRSSSRPVCITMSHPQITQAMTVKNEETRESPENPLRGKVLYRPIARSEPIEGEGIAFSGSRIRFSGEQSLSEGAAAEVRIEAVKGLSPALTAYIEISRCEPDDLLGFCIEGTVKGLLTH